MDNKHLHCHYWYILRGCSLVFIITLLSGCISSSTLSPTLKPAPQVIYISPGGQGTIHALRASNGASLWQYQNPEQSVVNAMTEANGVIYAWIGHTVYSSPSPNSLEALRADNGRLLWCFQGTTILQAPIVTNGVVYITVEDQQHYTLWALRASNGSVIWSSQLHLDAGAYLINFSVVDGIVYAISRVGGTTNTPPTDGTVSALQASNGKLLWQYRPNNGQSGAIVLLAAGGKVAIGASHEVSLGQDYCTLSFLKSKDGSVLWQFREANATLQDLLAWQENLLYLHMTASLDHQHYHDAVFALRVKDGKVAWSYQLAGRANGDTLVIHHNILYVGSWPDETGQTSGNNLLALQTNNGKLLWQRSFPDLDFTVSQLVVTDKAIYINDLTHAPQSGEIRAVRINNGSPLWNQQISKGPVSLLAVEGPIVYAGIRGVPTEGMEDPWNGGEMCAYQAATGKTIWCQQTSYSLLSFIIGS